MENMNKQMLMHIGNTIFVFSPIIGYIPQIISRNIVFSPILSLLLILSGITKYYYWRVEHFNSIILYQAFFLIFVQLFLVYNFNQRLGVVEESFYACGRIDKMNKRYSVFFVNLGLVCMAVVAIHFLTYLGSPSVVYTGCGVLSMVLESSVGVVQLFLRRMDLKYSIGEKSEKRRLSKELFLCWIIGDVAKLYWMFIIPATGVLFVPVIFQILIDLVLMSE